MKIGVKTNIASITGELNSKLKRLTDKDYLLRPVCFDLIDLMTNRIHNRGNAADDSPIGTYSRGYLAVRQKKYNRSSDNKVIVSLTRQLENDWSVIATANGYAIGFLNQFNLQKARWVESIKEKRIFQLSQQEQDYATNRLNEIVSQALQ